MQMPTRNFKLNEVYIKLEKGKKLVSETPLNSPSAAVRLLAEELQSFDREAVVVVNLNGRLQPINYSIVSIGALDNAIAEPREILKSAILSNAKGIILLHNHPSGDIYPSRHDTNITDRINKICGWMGLQFFDHIIVGGNNNEQYFSFRERKSLDYYNPPLICNYNMIQYEPIKVASSRNER